MLKQFGSALKKFLKKAWVLKIVSHDTKSVRIYRVKPLHIILFLLAFYCLYSLVFAGFNKKTAVQKEEIKKLSVTVQKHTSEVKRLKKENAEAAELLSKQDKEFSRKLTELQKQDNEIRRMVGLKPKTLQKTSIKASRGGKNIAELKRRSEDLHQDFALTQEEVKKLKVAVVKYKKNERRKEILATLESTPTDLPLYGSITSGYGWRSHPFGWGSEFHNGIDVSAGYGTAIHATARGKVSHSGYYGGYGYTIIIDHGNGWQTLYGHCSRLAVSEGEHVKKGQVVAYVGSTGASTGPHVHYSVYRNGKVVNPEVCAGFIKKEKKLLAKLK